MKLTGLMRSLIAFSVFASVLCAPLQAQPEPLGDYAGVLGDSLHVKLHIRAANGTLSGTVDSVDQGAMGLVASDFHVEDGKLSFSVPVVGGKWTGTIADGGATLAGTWSQGQPLPLTFNRDEFVPAAKPSAVDGVWLGPGLQSMRVQITVKSDAQGHERCTLDGIDQDIFGQECANVVFAGLDFSFEVPGIIAGRYAGKLSADGNSLSGTFTNRRNQAATLNMTRQEKALTPQPPVMSDAIAPVSVQGMQSTLDRDFAPALAGGSLAPVRQIGVTIGVWQHGVRRVFAYGTAKPDSIYEIGSVTKTFTGLILAAMIGEGQVKLDQPVRELLPAGTVAKPEGREILLLDLVTQHSGLPRMPDNFKPTDQDNPYADYGTVQMYEFTRQHGVARPSDAGFVYSNFGFGLLGQALVNRAGISYEALLKQEITLPLGMKDTTVTLNPAQQSRFITGHDPLHQPAHAWDLVAFAGAGAIRSTADDLLNYVQAQLHPEKLPAAARSLAAAIRLSHELRDSGPPSMHIGFAWLHEDDTGTYWHDGGTGGYSSYVFFNPDEDAAGVVLVNTTLGPRGSLANVIGQHIAQRFAGKPAIEP